MSDVNTIETIEKAEGLPDGQWIQDADGDFACLMDTHMGFPQRMAMPKGGRMLLSLDKLTYPLLLCDLDLPEPCPHTWGLIGEGHCRRCGELIDWRPTYFDEDSMRLFREVAAMNSRNETRNKPTQ